jgi:hypothetical protein
MSGAAHTLPYCLIPCKGTAVSVPLDVPFIVCKTLDNIFTLIAGFCGPILKVRSYARNSCFMRCASN